MEGEGSSVECPVCKEWNPSAFRFCGACGSALERRCPSCSAVMPARFQYCGGCGAALLSSEPDVRSSEERKVVSVLFADLVASTELATRLDPEDLRTIYSSYFEAMSAALVRYGGTVEKFIGDAVVGIFGAPVTHEDDPERAVRAGRAMQSALVELNRQLGDDLGEDLALRIGVHTGEVIATPGDANQALVTGETTSIAARLQSVAPRGGLVVGGRTYRDAARSFHFEPLGAVQLKGVPEPVEAWLVVAESTRSADREGPLLGRAEELAFLDVLLRRCEREGRPHLATVVGPAGIGKTRLVLEFIGTTEVRTVRGSCLPYGSGLRLWPFGEMVKEEASILDSDPPDVIEAKARDRLGWRFDEKEPRGSTLATLLSSIGIPLDPDPLAGVGRETAQRMIATAWSDYFSTLTSGDAVIAWIEDVHWADDAVLELLDRLVGRIEAPILFLCLARPELLERRPEGWLTRGGSISTFELGPLSSSDCVSLVAGQLDSPADPKLSAAIVERSGGNPFFARELTQVLVEDGSIERREGVWAASSDITAAMPDTIQTAIAARLDRLEPAHKAVIQMASVVGRDFWVVGPGELGDADIDRAIDTLMARRLIRSRASSSIAGSSEFTFEHALIRDVAYGSIPRSRRSEAHRSVLDWMERGTRGRDEEFAEMMAYHAESAGDPERTARFAMLAGHRHRRVYAAEDAIRWYELAARAVEQLPKDWNSSVRSEILHSRGEALVQIGRYEEACADFERALEIGRATHRAWLEAQELAAIADALRSLEKFEEAESVLPKALEAAREAGLQYLEARVKCLAGGLAWDRGDPVRARAELDEGLRISQEAHDLEGEAFARTGLTEIGLCQGPFDQAIADGMRAHQLWQRLGQRPRAHAVAQMLGYLRLLTGDVALAESLFEMSLAGSRELGMGREEPLPRLGLALTAMARGELGLAMGFLDEAVEAAELHSVTKGAVGARLCRVLLLHELGAPEQAVADIEAVDALVTAPASYLGPVRLAARACLLLASGDRAAAIHGFERARSHSEGMLLSRVACGRLEILSWSAAGEERAAADAATWVLEGASGRCPAVESLAEWAIARESTERRSELAGSALKLARRAGDKTVLWRALALAEEEARERGDPEAATRLREEARGAIRTLAMSLTDDGLRSNFLSGTEVAELLRGDPNGLDIR